MNRTEIQALVEGALSELQEISGDAETEITEYTCPVSDLDYDSIRTVEAAIYVGEAIGCRPEQALKLFEPTGEAPIVSVRDIINRSCDLLAISS